MAENNEEQNQQEEEEEEKDLIQRFNTDKIQYTNLVKLQTNFSFNNSLHVSSNFLLISKKYGYIILANNNQFSFIKLQDNDNLNITNFPQISIPSITSMALSPNELTLSVSSKNILYFFAIPSLNEKVFLIFFKKLKFFSFIHLKNFLG